MKKIAILIILSSLFFACEEENKYTNVGNRNPLMSILPSDPDLYDLVAQYDTTNLVGLIDIETNFDDVKYTILSDTLERNISESRVLVTFYNSDFTNSLEVGQILINGDSLPKVGDYSYMAEFFPAIPNTLSIDSNYNFPGIDTTFTFSTNPMITNIARNDTLDKTDDIDISWVGINSDYVQIQIMDLRHIESQTDQTYYFSKFAVNNGNFTIPSSAISSFPDGSYLLNLIRFEPKFFTMSNGKKIVVLQEYTYSISIVLD